MTRFKMGGIFATDIHLLFNFKSLSTMGRKNLILGNASGKLGDVVFYRDGGEQRFRTRVTPANPQSMAQQSQRSRLGGVTNTFRAAKGILADTFESKAVNQSGFNAFSATALPTAPYLPKTAVAVGAALPMPMALSKGSLPQPFSVYLSGDAEIVAEMSGLAFGKATGNTIGEFSKALIDWKPCVFHDGVVIMLVLITYSGGENLGLETIKPNLVVEKFVVDSTSTGALPTEFGLYSLEWNTTARRFYCDSDGEYYVGGVFVVDDTLADGLHVSSCDAVLSNSAQTLYENHITDAARIAAAESYGGSNQRCVI